MWQIEVGQSGLWDRCERDVYGRRVVESVMLDVQTLSAVVGMVTGVGEGEEAQSVRIIRASMMGEDGPQEVVFGVLARVGCGHAGRGGCGVEVTVGNDEEDAEVVVEDGVDASKARASRSVVAMGVSLAATGDRRGDVKISVK